MIDTRIIAWFGWGCIVCAAFPQIMSLRNHARVNPLTYVLVLVGCTAYAIRAWAIQEIVWFISSLFTVGTSLVVLWLLHTTHSQKSVDG